MEFLVFLMWFWHVNEMTELVSGMPAPSGVNLHECEDQC
jgi:hypothetical protein